MIPLRRLMGEFLTREFVRTGEQRCQLAARAGVTERTLRRVLRGEHMSVDVIDAIVEALGVEFTIVRKVS